MWGKLAESRDEEVSIPLFDYKHRRFGMAGRGLLGGGPGQGGYLEPP